MFKIRSKTLHYLFALLKLEGKFIITFKIGRKLCYYFYNSNSNYNLFLKLEGKFFIIFKVRRKILYYF